jgi:hypothetical protein
MSARFRIDLLHPGRVATTWKDWFVGPQGRRRLGVVTLACLAILIVILVGGLLPGYWRLSDDLNAIPRLRRDLAATETDLGVLRNNLRALTAEARRQVRWGDLLATFSQQTPPALRLQRVEASKVTPPPAPGQAAGEVRGEAVLKVEASTPLRPGSPPLLEVAQFMAGIMKDPGVNKRYQLKNWEIKPPPLGGGEEPQYLTIVVTLSERAQ